MILSEETKNKIIEILDSKEFMCRTVEDYRVKDFINYIKVED